MFFCRRPPGIFAFPQSRSFVKQIAASGCQGRDCDETPESGLSDIKVSQGMKSDSLISGEEGYEEPITGARTQDTDEDESFSLSKNP